MIGGARLSRVDHQLDDRVLTGPGHPRNSSDSRTLAKQMEDAGTGFVVELIHGSTI